MPFLILSWNLNPNRVWFARMADAGSNISVELYLTQGAAQAQTGRQAHGHTDGFGSSLPVTLTSDTGAVYPVSLFQSAYPWHLKVSGQDGDATKIYRLKEFVDLDEISHPIYRNAALITSRAIAEIDAHTHAKVTKEVELGSHLPELEPGHIVRLNSSRRGKDETLQGLEVRIVGEISDDKETKLTTSVTVGSYLELKR